MVCRPSWSPTRIVQVSMLPFGDSQVDARRWRCCAKRIPSLKFSLSHCPSLLRELRKGLFLLIYSASSHVCHSIAAVIPLLLYTLLQCSQLVDAATLGWVTMSHVFALRVRCEGSGETIARSREVTDKRGHRRELLVGLWDLMVRLVHTAPNIDCCTPINTSLL